MSLLSDWFNKRVIGPAYEGVKALDSMTGGPEYRKRNAPMWQAMAQDAGDVLKAPFVELPPERKERLYDNIGNMISPQTGMFIGPKAVLSSTEQKALKKAMMMRSQGKTRDETMAGTDGWFWLKDGKFRKEIDDSGADYLHHKLPKFSPFQDAAGVKQDHALLGDVYKHPELYQRYPAMANDRVIPLDPEQSYLGVNYGRWGPTGRGDRELEPFNTIGMQHPGGPMGLTSKELAAVINHEITHSIQGTERYTSGGNPESIIGQLMREPEYARSIGPLVKEVEHDPKAYQTLKNNLYRALLSEEEANLSQTRRNYSATDRRIVKPWSDFQFPEAAQVVIDRNTGDVIPNSKLPAMAQAIKEAPVDPVLQANKTARSSGAIGAKAITPRYVQDTVQPGETVLNFGAGKKDKATNSYLHSDMIRKNGGVVDEYDFGSNSVGKLGNQYDTVFASNVLNVQNDKAMLISTLNQIKNSTKGRAVFNFPESPRYLKMTPEEVAMEIKNIFGVEPKRVGGTKKAPLWEIRTGNN